MHKSTEDILAMFKRIKNCGDGLEFIEYLEDLSKDNYEAFKCDDEKYNEEHKGYAKAIDNLIRCFAQCDKDVIKPPEVDWA